MAVSDFTQRLARRPTEALTVREARAPSFDTALAVVAFAVTVMLLYRARHSLGVIELSLAAVATLPLLVWRRSPAGVMVLMLAASATMMAAGFPGQMPVGATVALFLLSSSRDRDRPWTARLTLLVAGLLAIHIGAYAVGHGHVPGLQSLGAALLWSGVWFAGDRRRLSRVELAQEQERAITQERARIARDLHDSVAHAIAVIGVQAGAARMHLGEGAERPRQAIEVIESVARSTVIEIDQIIRGLRDSSDPEGEAPRGLAMLDDLLEQHRVSGHSVSLERSAGRCQLRPSVDQAAYRILQEALTNSARHGAGAGTHVRLNFGERALQLSVVNDVTGGGAARGGHGLVGMRERAQLLGGSFITRADHGRFEVAAVLPYGP